MNSSHALTSPPTGLLLTIIAYAAFISLGLPDAVTGVAWPSIQDSFSVPTDTLGDLGRLMLRILCLRRTGRQDDAFSRYRWIAEPQLFAGFVRYGDEFVDTGLVAVDRECLDVGPWIWRD